ncbi:hypothetical protein B5F40_02380 [Gordonibacter sp. An230]|uniref:hypothetical protein n=1 Tax=Gordonibacter sp. An230 TaxID=1965592 RepID=UPI000B57D9C2|nr:hypothetical protein [Gordonibacter sp. An230]OUO91813.1 hypothetical protein B5F40_02380 [Gordonibacter sp. An230]
MNAKTALASAALAAAMSCTMLGCSSDAEIPVAPGDSNAGATSSDSYTLTDEDKLSALAVGETAVWKDYEVTVSSIDRTGGQLVAHVQVKSHGRPLTLETGCLLSFGMPPTSSSFTEGMIEVAAGEVAEGTLSFDDQYGSERLFWNDGATEAAWDLTLPSVQDAPEQQGGDTQEETVSEQPEQNEASEADEAQKSAIATLEAELPSLFANNTFYVYQGVDSSTATVTPLDSGGYEYVNNVSILDGAGYPATANVRLVCEPNGNCISMTIDGMLLF